eukprot:1838845-Rhodomonas_salina.1
MLTGKVLEYFRDLRDTWSKDTNFGCPCADGSRSYACCSAEDLDGWTAFLSGMARQKELSGTALTDIISGRLATFLQDELQHSSREILTAHSGPVDYSWSDEEALLA